MSLEYIKELENTLEAFVGASLRMDALSAQHQNTAENDDRTSQQQDLARAEEQFNIASGKLENLLLGKNTTSYELRDLFIAALDQFNYAPDANNPVSADEERLFSFALNTLFRNIRATLVGTTGIGDEILASEHNTQVGRDFIARLRDSGVTLDTSLQNIISKRWIKDQQTTLNHKEILEIIDALMFIILDYIFVTADESEETPLDKALAGVEGLVLQKGRDTKFFLAQLVFDVLASYTDSDGELAERRDELLAKVNEIFTGK